MQKIDNRVKLSVVDGRLRCPNYSEEKGSRRCPNKFLMRIDPDTDGHGVCVYCRRCGENFKIDIENGVCYMSPSR